MVTPIRFGTPMTKPFPDPASLFVKPDHYIFRMLYSQGVRLEDFGVPRQDGGPVEADGRKIWRLFAKNFYLFRGTPSRLWFEHALETVFGIEERLGEKNADALYDRIAERLTEPSMRPRGITNSLALKSSRRPMRRPINSQRTMRS